MGKNGFKLSFTLLLTLVSGCVGNYVQTPEEFREIATNTLWNQITKENINRSVSQIGRSFVDKSNECLNVTIVATDNYNRNLYEIYLLSEVSVEPRSVEMVIREKYPKKSSLLMKPPENGFVFFVIDVTPISTTSSRLVMYHPKARHQSLSRAILEWARGNTRGCPVLGIRS